MFAFVVHCAGTPLNIEGHTEVSNATLHAIGGPAPPHTSAFIAMLIDRRLYSIFLSSISDCCNEKTTTSKNQRYAPAPPVWQLHLRLAVAFARNRASFTSLAAAAWQPHSNITLASRVLILLPFQISRDGGRWHTFLCHCSSCRAASFRGSVAVRPSFPALPAVRYSKLPSVAVSAQGIIVTGRSFHRRVTHVTAARATISVL